MTEPLDLKKLREIRDAATQEEWTYMEYGDIDDEIELTFGGIYVYYRTGRNDYSRKDADFITTFNPEMVGRLLDRIEELKERVQKWKRFKEMSHIVGNSYELVTEFDQLRKELSND